MPPPESSLVPELSGLTILRFGNVERSFGPETWHNMVSLAIHHGLGSCVYRCIGRENRRDSVPPALMRALFLSYMADRVASHRVLGDSTAALDVLARAGVEVIALKGLHLASCYYESISERLMGDIDLLVRPDQMWLAFDTLREYGYVGQRERQEWKSRPARHLPRLLSQDVTPVELHWTIGSPKEPFHIDTEQLWARSRPLCIGPRTVSALCPEHLVLHLCIHAVHQHLCRVPLRNVYDIALVIRRHPNDLDWDLLTTTALAFGARRAVFCGLLLAREVFGANVPGPILDSVAPGVDRTALLRSSLAAILSFDIPVIGWLRQVDGERMPPRQANGVIHEALTDHLLPPESDARKASGLGRFWRRLTRSVLLILRYRRLLVGLALLRPDARARLRATRAAVSVKDWLLASK